MPSDLTNQPFGDYHILRRIGSGAMADVYLAEQRSLGRRVALKVLKPELAHDETYTRRFVREARAIAQLIHPNLVQIFQADRFGEYWFIAQEYVQGQTLQERIRRGGPMPFKEIAEILWQVSSALEKAARIGIVHRDIKPDNILLGDDGHVKIADFGLVRVNDPGKTEDEATALTQVGMTLGTPLYMSPEQAQGKPLDQRSDLYSLGITCYHALAGRPPFRGDTALAVALQHVNQQPEPLERLRPDIPPALSRLVHRMIEKSPADRIQTFHDIQAELRVLYAVFLRDEDPAAKLTDWNRFAVGESDEKLLLTTERLQELLETEKILRSPGRRRLSRILLLFCAALLLGGALGYFRVASMGNPLHAPRSSTTKKQPTVEEQWVYASLLNTPEAWQSVIDYFPAEDSFWSRKAKRQLIRYYFHHDDSWTPLPLFQEFASLSDVDIQERALGLAGIAWCYAENQDDMTVPLDSIRQLSELNFLYSDSLLIQILDAANRTIRRKKDFEQKNIGRPDAASGA